MAEYVDTYIKCWQCRGVGTRPPDDELCPYCHGEGKIHNGHLDVTELKLPTNAFYSYQVWEATDMAEYNALSASNKGIYKDIVNMGTVSLREDSNSRGILMGLFGAGTTTRANLAALLE